MKRLTVYLKGVKKIKVKIKENGEVMEKEKIKNTFTINDVERSEIDTIIERLILDPSDLKSHNIKQVYYNYKPIPYLSGKRS